MALNAEELGDLLYNALLEADREVLGDKGLSDKLSVPGAKEMMQAQAAKMAETLVEYIKNNADVIIPEHEPRSVSIQAQGGPGPHTGANLSPVIHRKGKIE